MPFTTCPTHACNCRYQLEEQSGAPQLECMCHQQQGGARFACATCAPGCFLAAGFLAAGFLAGLNCASSSSLQTVEGRCMQVRLW